MMVYALPAPSVVRHRQRLAARHAERAALRARGLRELPDESQRRQHARVLEQAWAASQARG